MALKSRNKKKIQGRIGRLTRPGRIGRLRRPNKILRLKRKNNGSKVTS